MKAQREAWSEYNEHAKRLQKEVSKKHTKFDLDYGQDMLNTKAYSKEYNEVIKPYRDKRDAIISNNVPHQRFKKSRHVKTISGYKVNRG